MEISSVNNQTQYQKSTQKYYNAQPAKKSRFSELKSEITTKAKAKLKAKADAILSDEKKLDKALTCLAVAGSASLAISLLLYGRHSRNIALNAARADSDKILEGLRTAARDVSGNNIGARLDIKDVSTAASVVTGAATPNINKAQGAVESVVESVVDKDTADVISQAQTGAIDKTPELKIEPSPASIPVPDKLETTGAPLPSKIEQPTDTSPAIPALSSQGAAIQEADIQKGTESADLLTSAKLDEEFDALAAVDTPETIQKTQDELTALENAAWEKFNTYMQSLSKDELALVEETAWQEFEAYLNDIKNPKVTWEQIQAYLDSIKVVKASNPELENHLKNIQAPSAATAELQAKLDAAKQAVQEMTETAEKVGAAADGAMETALNALGKSADALDSATEGVDPLTAAINKNAVDTTRAAIERVKNLLTIKG